jgi:hypothetical protein
VENTLQTGGDSLQRSRSFECRYRYSHKIGVEGKCTRRWNHRADEIVIQTLPSRLGYGTRAAACSFQEDHNARRE